MEKIITLSLVTVLGALLGSFTTMLVYRLHHDQKGIFTGRSQCPSCGVTLNFWNLVPIFSWLFQRGKCHSCKRKIPIFYPITEIIFTFCFFIFAQHFYETWHLFPILGIVFVALILFFYDIRFLEVDDRIIIPSILLVAIYAFYRDLGWEVYFIGGGLGFSFYAFQYVISDGKWVGAGDIRLGLFMGLCLGWKLTILSLFLAYIFGLLFALPLLILKKADRKTPLPMGAFLMPSLLIFLYSGDVIWNWYMHLTLFGL